jgi:hypothetical protein
MNADDRLMLEALQMKWKLTSMSPADAEKQFGKHNVKVTARGLRNGQDMVEVQVPVDDKGHDAAAEDAEHNAAQRIIASELHKVHTILNQLSTMIDLNRSAETDQLLSKIRDVSEMLMSDTNTEDEDSEHRSNAQHAAIAIALQKAGKKPS